MHWIGTPKQHISPSRQVKCEIKLLEGHLISMELIIKELSDSNVYGVRPHEPAASISTVRIYLSDHLCAHLSHTGSLAALLGLESALLLSFASLTILYIILADKLPPHILLIYF